MSTAIDSFIVHPMYTVNHSSHSKLRSIWKNLPWLCTRFRFAALADPAMGRVFPPRTSGRKCLTLGLLIGFFSITGIRFLWFRHPDPISTRAQLPPIGPVGIGQDRCCCNHSLGPC